LFAFLVCLFASNNQTINSFVSGTSQYKRQTEQKRQTQLEGACESAYLRQVKRFEHYYCKMWKFSQEGATVPSGCV